MSLTSCQFTRRYEWFVIEWFCLHTYQQVILLMTFCVTMPLSMMRDITTLAKWSLLAIFAILFVAVTLIVEIHIVERPDDRRFISHGHLITLAMHLIVSFISTAIRTWFFIILVNRATCSCHSRKHAFRSLGWYHIRLLSVSGITTTGFVCSNNCDSAFVYPPMWYCTGTGTAVLLKCSQASCMPKRY